MKLKTRLILSFIVISGGIGILGAISIFELSEIEKSAQDIPEKIEAIGLSSELDSHAQLIRYYDEVLTQSARNYAFTQDKIWKDRYIKYEPLLDAEINHALKDGEETVSKLFRNVDDANRRLVEMEYQSIKLVEQGNSQEAINILQSQEYWEDKASYEQSLRAYIEIRGIDYLDILAASTVDIKDSVSNVSENIFSASLVLSILIPITIAGSIALGITISHSITKPISNLEEVSRKIAKGNFDRQAEISGSDETKQLAKTFNDMAKSLKKTVELEKQLVRAEENIKKERFTAIGELAGNLAHDIRNPLSIIKNSLDIIKTEKDNPHVFEKSIVSCDHAIMRINHQINEILDFLRATPLELEQKSIQHIVKSVLKNMDIPNNITTSLSSEDVEIECDRHKIESAIYNIVYNAIQAIDKDNGSISIDFKKNNDGVVIEISNTGPPILEELLPRIFDPLYTTKYKGTGLGLPSCKRMIELHKGQITVNPDPVSFKINLPLKQ